MRLAYPWLLLLLLLIPVLAWLRYGQRNRVRVQYSDLSLFEQAPVSWAVRMQPLLPALFVLGLAGIVVALSRPQKGLEESISSADVVDIVMLVDTSRSMNALDLSPGNQPVTRISAAKKVVKEFIARRPQDRFSVIAFGSVPFTMSPLTLSQDFLQEQVDRLNISIAGDGTAIGSAIAAGTNRLLESKTKSRLMILLTDGVNTAGTMDPLDAAQIARTKGFKIYTIAVGEEGRIPMLGTDFFGREAVVPMQSEIDTETLIKIAELTGGRYFRARKLTELEKVYEDIDQMERTETKVENFTRYDEKYHWAALFGMICLGLEQFFSATRLGRTLE